MYVCCKCFLTLGEFESSACPDSRDPSHWGTVCDVGNCATIRGSQAPQVSAFAINSHPVLSSAPLQKKAPTEVVENSIYLARWFAGMWYGHEYQISDHQPGDFIFNFFVDQAIQHGSIVGGLARCRASMSSRILMSFGI